MANEIDHNDFIKPFPRWYTPVKWGIPLVLAIVAGVLAGLMVANIMAMPAALSMFQWLPELYASLESLGAFTLLATSFGIASTMTALLTSIVTRVCLYKYVEDLAQDNINGNEYMSKFRNFFTQNNDEKQALEKQRHKEEKAKLEDAVVTYSERYRTTKAENAQLRAKLGLEGEAELEGVPEDVAETASKAKTAQSAAANNAATSTKGKKKPA